MVEDKNKVGGLTLLNLQTDYKAAVTIGEMKVK